MSELNFDASQDYTDGAQVTDSGTGGTLPGFETERDDTRLDFGDGAGTGETTGPDGEPLKAMTPPVEYEDFDLPEDFSVNDGLMGEFKDFASRRGLSQEDAQALLDLQVRTHAQALEGVVSQRRSWREEIRKDPEFGGTNFHSTLRHAKRGLTRLDPTGEVMACLEQTGYGDNPEIIRLFARFSREFLTEDETHTGFRPGGYSRKSLEDRLWPDM